MGCLDANAVMAYVGGELDDHQRRRIDEHIDGCHDCAKLLAEAAADVYRSDARTGPDPGSAAGSDPSATTVGHGGTQAVDVAPERVGRYRIVRMIGRGAMGTVYEARDPKLDRRIAVKVLRSRRAADSQSRLLREAQAMARLSHPNVIEVHDVGTEGGRVYIAMELLAGEDLRAWMRRGTHPWREVTAILLQAAAGLSAAHAAGLLHRDFKPDNVFVADDGRVRVMDFGLARPMGGTLSEPTPAPTISTDEWSQRLTQTGTVVGTPAYMPGEQWEGRPLDPRADQFAFAVTYWEALFGRRPFTGARREELHAAVRAGKLPDVTAGDVPAWLRRVLARALRPDRDDRYPSIDALVTAVRRGLDRPRRLRRGLIGVGAALLVTTAAFATDPGSEGPPCRDGPDRFAAHWNPTRAAAIERAFAATDLPYAASTAARVVDRLDAYGQRWADAHDAACRERTGAPLDATMACLRRLGLEVDATIARLQATPDAVDTALRSTLALPPVSTCDAPVASVGPEAAALEDELIAAGGNGAAEARLAAARRVAQRASTQGFDRVAARAMHRASTALEDLGRYEEAHAMARRAADVAETTADDELAAQAWISVAFLAGTELRRFEEAERGLRFAAARVQRVGDPARLRARLELARAVIELRAGHFEAAATAQQAALRAAEAAEDDPLLAARARSSGGAIAYARGDHARARQEHAHAREVLRQALGEAHPAHVAELANEANALLRLGEVDEAVALTERAIELAMQSAGGRAGFLDELRNNLAQLYTTQGRYEEAVVLLTQAAQSLRRDGGDTHPVLPMVVSNLAYVRARMGDHEAALAGFRQALALRTASHGPQHVALAYDWQGIGDAELALGHPDAAVEALRQAVALWADSAVDPYETAAARYLLAKALRELDPDSEPARQQLRLAATAIADDPQADAESLRARIEADLAD